MNRYVYMGIRNLLHIPVWAADVARRNYAKERFDIADNYRMIRKMVRRIIRTGNINLEISGQENLPKNPGYAVYMNHQGYFDALALIEAVDEPFVILAMKELDELPFVRYVMRLLRTVYLDRGDLHQSMYAIRECTELLRQEKNILIFPEGTLEEEENVLLPYKAGAFKAAVQAKAPVVPVALRDSFLPFERKGAQKVTVYLTILPPLFPEDYRGMKTTRIAERVRQETQKEILG